MDHKSMVPLAHDTGYIYIKLTQAHAWIDCRAKDCRTPSLRDGLLHVDVKDTFLKPLIKL